jgi:hypothetical protein
MERSIQMCKAKSHCMNIWRKKTDMVGAYHDAKRFTENRSKSLEEISRFTRLSAASNPTRFNGANVLAGIAGFARSAANKHKKKSTKTDR